MKSFAVSSSKVLSKKTLNWSRHQLDKDHISSAYSSFCFEGFQSCALIMWSNIVLSAKSSILVNKATALNQLNNCIPYCQYTSAVSNLLKLHFSLVTFFQFISVFFLSIYFLHIYFCLSVSTTYRKNIRVTQN